MLICKMSAKWRVRTAIANSVCTNLQIKHHRIFIVESMQVMQ